MTDTAEQWDERWRKYSRSALRNPAQAYRRKLILSLLMSETPRPLRVLDVGSGQGDMARALLRADPEIRVLGLELSAFGVSIAREKVPAARFLQRDLMESAAVPAEFAGWANFAVCSEVLEHVDDPVRLLRHAAAYMASGCKVVVTVPGGPMSAFDRQIGHRRHFRAGELKEIAEKAGFRVRFARGAGFPFFNLYRLTVLARGRRLIEDVGGSDLSLPARAAMRAFDILFRFNLDRGPAGWQIVALLEAA
ncbi:MAG TPA: class I SAM-dependent methyltransferase [Thermoanaerobaculia bacterium]|nr:class I SAM-dependent methyltransferase [Thermoanaerobaculia bacterium]